MAILRSPRLICARISELGQVQTPTTIASTSALEATSEVIRVKEDIAARMSPIGGSSDVNQKFIQVRS